MRIGKQNISSTQAHFLESLSEKFELDSFVGYLREVISDEEILEEEEDVHPDWYEYFKTNKENLKDIEGGKFFQDCNFFFAEEIKLEESVSQIDAQKTKICFLLGAGASKPKPSGIPTVNELLPQLLEKARRLDREDVTNLADYCEDQNIGNIEDLMTAAYLATFCSRNPTVLGLMDYLLSGNISDPSEMRYSAEKYPGIRRRRQNRKQFIRRPNSNMSSIAFMQDTLQVLFGLLSSTMLPAMPNPAHLAIAEYARKREGLSIVTTNYDCCMDLALGDPNHDFTYRIEFDNKNRFKEEPISCSRLIKLHGSLNWYYCETCQKVQLIDIRKSVKSYLDDTSPFAVIALCKDCGGQRRGLVVPPLAMKFDFSPTLTSILNDAEEAFSLADMIVAIGFSFSEADLYITRMISKSMQKSPSQKLLVVDPDANVAKRVKRKFRANIPDFDEGRVLRVLEDCSVFVPKLLAVKTGLVKEEPTEQLKETK